MSSSQPAFETLVIQALDDLPESFARALDNVDIVVEQEPSHEQRRGLVPPGMTLFGLYEGIPQTQRTSGYGLVAPDKITIFEGPIRRASHDEQSLIRLVRRTVLHELAHHFGISDERLRELGAY